MTNNSPLIALFFNRGAFVTWGYPQRWGIVECESTIEPGWYYVRNEHGDLDKIHWAHLTLARKVDQPKVLKPGL